MNDPRVVNGREEEIAPIRQATGGAKELIAAMPRLILEARRAAASVFHGLHGRRRAGPGDTEAPIAVGGLLLDPISHRVTIDGKPAEIGPTEYRLLQFFMTHQERAYTRSQLLDQVWGGNVYVEERTVDVHIRRLRKALGEVYENLVQTVRGTGYRFSTKG